MKSPLSSEEQSPGTKGLVEPQVPFSGRDNIQVDGGVVDAQPRWYLCSTVAGSWGGGSLRRGNVSTSEFIRARKA